jgi:hypothetical protein
MNAFQGLWRMRVHTRSLLRRRTKLTLETGRGPKWGAKELARSVGFNLLAPGYRPFSVMILCAESNIPCRGGSKYKNHKCNKPH